MPLAHAFFGKFDKRRSVTEREGVQSSKRIAAVFATMPRTARRRPRVSLRCCVFTLLALAVGVVHLAAQIAAPSKVAPQAVAKPESEVLPPHAAVDADEDEDEREDFGGDAARSARVRVVFSTDCTPYQDWQSEVVFNSADVVGHRGPVTRVASGCSPEKEAALRQRYAALYGARARRRAPRSAAAGRPPSPASSRSRRASPGRGGRRRRRC